MQEVTIMVVDDESKIRRLVLNHLESEGFDVLSAADGDNALKVFKIAPDKPDLVLIDVMMPDMDGFACARALRKIAPNLPIIFVTAKSDSNSMLNGFELGADDYITKPFSLEELSARIKAVLRRTISNTSNKVFDEIVNGPLRINPSNHTFKVLDKEIHLADTEFRLLLSMMKFPGRVFSHEQLLRSVWGEEYIGELPYLRVAFTRIRKKIEEAGIEGGVISAYSGVGYVLRDLKEEY